MQPNWVVLKFGGTSVSSHANWTNIAQVCNNRVSIGHRVLLVVSAVTKISDMLDELCALAVKNQHGEKLSLLISTHLNLLADLGIDPKAIDGNIDILKRLLLGISLLEYCDARAKAQVFSAGELLSSSIGYAFLKKLGSKAAFLDARKFLKACSASVDSIAAADYLNAECEFSYDENLAAYLTNLGADIVITQGFIASNEAQETVLLGRGGSDTSASYFGCKLKAQCVEIWTDVPGMFTSNPHDLPSALLLRQLDYDEAQEIATMGAKVLHPRCIAPLKISQIPLKICWTKHPYFAGTQIAVNKENKPKAQVKAVIIKRGVRVISMESFAMWQQIGFLADVFRCFKKRGFSIDLISSSQSNVTVTLDPFHDHQNEEQFNALISDLKNFCSVKTQAFCATISLVGSHIRSIIHQLGASFSVFAEKNIYLISQSASNLNFSFTLDQENVDAVLEKMHSNMFGQKEEESIFGPSWENIEKEVSSAKISLEIPWWIKKKEALLAKIAQEEHAYFYNLPSVEEAFCKIKKISSVAKVFYAVKANDHPEIIEVLAKLGCSFDCVSLSELIYAQKICADANVQTDFLFTPNFAAISEYKEAFNLPRTWVTVDNSFLLESYPDVFRGQKILLRIDPKNAQGHHPYVQTSGSASKFGIDTLQLPGIAKICAEHEICVIGLHAHVGSGIENTLTWLHSANFLGEIAKQFPAVQILDLGGGFAVRDRFEQGELALLDIEKHLANFKEANPQFDLWIEPGRFLVAKAGVLLGKVTQLKSKAGRHFVGVNIGMNSLLRPALYGAYHQITNLTRLDAAKELEADIVGPICESADVFGRARVLPRTEVGDVILLNNCGAYSRVMASEYNRRSIPKEICLRDHE